MTEAAASSPTYGVSQAGRTSEYAGHQPEVSASRARVAAPRPVSGERRSRGPAFQVLHLLVGRVGHGGDECGDDLEVLVAVLVHDGVGAVAEGSEEGQAGGPSLVGVAEVDDPVVGGMVAGAADAETTRRWSWRSGCRGAPRWTRRASGDSWPRCSGRQRRPCPGPGSPRGPPATAGPSSPPTAGPRSACYIQSPSPAVIPTPPRCRGWRARWPTSGWTTLRSW
jgi:hypothetical protein